MHGVIGIAAARFHMTDLNDIINDTIEAVARAICNSAEAGDYDRMREGIEKDLYRQQARAALEVALRALNLNFKTIAEYTPKGMASGCIPQASS